MALKPCRECGREVSTSAKTCPNCGIGYPTRGGNAFLWGVLALFALVVVISMSGGSNSKNGDDAGSASGAPSCSSDWTKCTDNADLANHYSKWSNIQFDCKEAADNQARYGTPKWPWLPFGAFSPGKDFITSGLAVAIEPDAQFQNGFGAMVHSEVLCTYDLKAKKVVDVNIVPK